MNGRARWAEAALAKRLKDFKRTVKKLISNICRFDGNVDGVNAFGNWEHDFAIASPKILGKGRIKLLISRQYESLRGDH